MYQPRKASMSVARKELLSYRSKGASLQMFPGDEFASKLGRKSSFGTSESWTARF